MNGIFWHEGFWMWALVLKGKVIEMGYDEEKSDLENLMLAQQTCQ